MQVQEEGREKKAVLEISGYTSEARDSRHTRERVKVSKRRENASVGGMTTDRRGSEKCGESASGHERCCRAEATVQETGDLRETQRSRDERWMMWTMREPRLRSMSESE